MYPGGNTIGKIFLQVQLQMKVIHVYIYNEWDDIMVVSEETFTVYVLGINLGTLMMKINVIRYTLPPLYSWKLYY